MQSMFDDLPAEGAGHEEDGEALADTNGIADAGTHDAGGLQRQVRLHMRIFATRSC